MDLFGPRDQNPGHRSGRQQPPPDDLFGEPPPPDELRRMLIHQSKDKNAKGFYGDRGMVEDFLRKHVFGKIVPDVLAFGVEICRLWKSQTEHIEPKFRTVRHTDITWKVPFRDSWLYVVFLFEVQSRGDWRMPVRMLLDTALAYDEICKEPDVVKARKLPPVLPIVVHVGDKPWTDPTALEDMLTDEAKAFMPFSLGHQFLLVSEVDEARSLERPATPREAGLMLRYPKGEREFKGALAALKTMLPPDSLARRPLLDWVRNAMITEGATEETMAKLHELEDLETLEDLEGPIMETWWARQRREAREAGHEAGREEGQRATVLRQTSRKFGPETAEKLAAVLDDVSDSGRVAEVADLIIDCANGRDLLERAGERT